MKLSAALRPRLGRALHLSAAAGLLAASTLANGCAAAAVTSASATSKGPANIIVVQGGSQSAQAGRELPVPVVLRVVDASGTGMKGVTVTLSIAIGGGTVTPASDTTDSHGEFKAKWTLGPGIVGQEIIAAVAGVDPIIIAAIGLLPTQMILVQGNGQSAKTGTVITNSIVVRVIGAGNLPMQGVTVGFQVLAGGGGMTPATVVTNALGEASTKWTLGAVGVQTALVASGTLAPVPLSATATP